MPYKCFLGYEKGEDKTPKIVELEAEIVRMIFRMFINGKTTSAIAKHLINNSILTPRGKITWQVATIESILTNEKYKGDALLQKTFTVDFLTKKVKENEGEIPQYYVQNSHPAIIEPDEFDEVQSEFERRKKLGRPNACHSPLSTKLICGDCGGFFGSKVWGSNTKYKKTIWRCNEKYKGGTKCATAHVTEDEVKEKFLDAFNSLIPYRDELIANCKLALNVLCDYSDIDSKLDELHLEIEVVTELSKKAISENANSALNQAEWQERHNGFLERHKKASEQIAELEILKQGRQGKGKSIEFFIKEMRKQKTTLESFDERLWFVSVESVTVMSAGELVFRFRDGTVV